MTGTLHNEMGFGMSKTSNEDDITRIQGQLFREREIAVTVNRDLRSLVTYVTNKIRGEMSDRVFTIIDFSNIILSIDLELVSKYELSETKIISDAIHSAKILNAVLSATFTPHSDSYHEYFHIKHTDLSEKITSVVSGPENEFVCSQNLARLFCNEFNNLILKLRIGSSFMVSGVGRYFCIRYPGQFNYDARDSVNVAKYWNSVCLRYPCENTENLPIIGGMTRLWNNVYLVPQNTIEFLQFLRTHDVYHEMYYALIQLNMKSTPMEGTELARHLILTREESFVSPLSTSSVCITCVDRYLDEIDESLPFIVDFSPIK